MAGTKHEVVISGIAGKFPECKNIVEFRDKLFAKENLIKSDTERWNPGKEEKPFYSGLMPDWTCFDATLFGVPAKLMRSCDPMMCHMLESSFEAMIDAGVNPVTLRGRNVCVISAPSISDAELLRVNASHFLEGMGMVGICRAMLANRMSYCFNFTGPSYNMDSTWISGVQALEMAAELVAQGTVEAAIVSSCTLLKYNSVDAEYSLYDWLDRNGKCSPFDAEGNGFARSEGVVSFFIQRAVDAKRHYCGILGAQTRFLGDRTCGLTRLNENLDTFYRDFYSDCKVDPADVAYVETGVTCNEDFDIYELNGLANVFCNKKDSQLLIGSQVGNIGNIEAPFSLVALVKAIMAMEGGVIPPTINYSTPHPRVPALVSGQLMPVTEPIELPGDLVGVNCHTYSGGISHVLVKRNGKVKVELGEGQLVEDEIPRLVILQARHEEGVRAIIDQLYTMPLDVEFVHMVNEVFKTPIPAYLWRGYTILPATGKKTPQNVKVFTTAKRPLWYVFSGMGSQWPGMGRDLLRLPIFAAAVDKCDKVLRPRGIDIKHILTTDSSTIFDNILNCFVGIATVQIGLVDILNALGLTPDGMLGHSVGELGCAYADGCFTAEEMVLAAYARGKASLESSVIPGMMAAVGMGYHEIKDRLPPSIDVACHNSSNSCTLSGPTDDVISYVDELKKNGVFAKAVSAGGIAYHSRYIKTVAPKLLAYLKETVTDPKPRSAKWVSSSVPEANWNTSIARFSSAEYHTNNLLNPVLFEEASKHVPKDAILVEIAPYGLLQAILKRSVNPDIINIALTNRSIDNNINHLLNAIGQLHLHYTDVDVNTLFPPQQYPVARGTPSLIGMVSWDHTETNFQELTSLVRKIFNKDSAVKCVDINSSEPEYQLWKDHCIEDQVLLPMSQLLMYPWKMFMDSKRSFVESGCVIFDNVTISDYISVDETEHSLTATFFLGSNNFEVSLDLERSLDAQSVLTGRLMEVSPAPETLETPTMETQDAEEVTEQEILSVLAHNGCSLGPQFQTIKKIFISENDCLAKVQWTGNLVTFLDALVNIVIFLKADENHVLTQPSFFSKLTINAEGLFNLPIDTLVDVHYNYSCNSVVCEHAELLGLTLSPISQKSRVLHWTTLKLQPYAVNLLSLEEFMAASIQLAWDSALGSWSKAGSMVKLLEVREDLDKPSLFTSLLSETAKSHPSIASGPVVVDVTKVREVVATATRQSYLVAGECITMASLSDSILTKHNVYCLTYVSNNGSPPPSQSLRPILVHQSSAGKFALFKKVNSQTNMKVFEVEDDQWLGKLSLLVSQGNNNQTVLVVSRTFTPRQLLPTLAAEYFADQLRAIFILDQNAPQFSVTSPIYSGQLALGLPVNILSGGVWASLRSVNLDVASNNSSLDCLVKSSQNGLSIACVGLNTKNFTISDEENDSDEDKLKYLDYSGNQGGKRVMGLAELDTDNNALTADPLLKWSIPADWTMEDAATVPITYCLAYYCILLKAKVLPGERVLVNAGMSPVGQALIAVTLQAGGDVFTSVASDDEAITLLKMFPTLKPNHVQVLGRQDVDRSIKKLTEGKGVEVIVNCLRGRDLQSSIKLMGYDCRFLHLGHVNVQARESVGMLVFLKRTAFFGVSLDNVANCDEGWKSRLREEIQKGIDRGVVKPFKRRSFPFKNQEQAISHLKTHKATEKTVLVAWQEGQVGGLTSSFQCNPDHLILIAGTKTELWLDVAEELAHRGARRLVVLIEEGSLVGAQVRRFNKLPCKNNIIIDSLTRVDTHESAIDLIKKLLRVATISSIFCVSMDENNSRMQNLDSASRQLLPSLQHFVSLLGEGVTVSEGRAALGLPALSVQSHSPLHKASRVLPYLFTLMASSSDQERFFSVSDVVSASVQSYRSEIQSYLPTSVEELHSIGLQVTDVPDFTEVVTRSPKYYHSRLCLLPVFMVSGLGADSLQPLFSQLMHPAFCASVPAAIESVSQYAECLLQAMLRIQEEGPYNLIGESWGGAVAMTLGCLLEARGQTVNLLLLGTGPSLALDRVSALCERYSADLSCSLLVAVLPLPPQTTKKILLASSWEERLQTGLEEVPVAQRVPVGKALSSLYSQLSALQRFQPSSHAFTGNVVLLSQVECLPADLNNLSQICRQTPNVVVTGDDDHLHLISSPTTGAVINENVSFDYKM